MPYYGMQYLFQEVILYAEEMIIFLLKENG